MLNFEKLRGQSVAIPVFVAIVALAYHLYAETQAARRREDALVDYIKTTTEILKADHAPTTVSISDSMFGVANFDGDNERTQ